MKNCLKSEDQIVDNRNLVFSASLAVALVNEARFNVQHGGLQPAVTNTLFTYGEYDPMRSLTVGESYHPTAVTIRVPQGGLSYDFYGIAPHDVQAVIDAKLDIMAVIRSWTRQ